MTDAALEGEDPTLRAIRRIRTAPGTVYTNEIAVMLGLVGPTDSPSSATDEAVLRHLNRWFETPLITVNPTSSRSTPGMVELVTATPMRLFIDLLLDHGDQVHPVGVQVLAEPQSPVVSLVMEYPELVLPTGPRDTTRAEWLERVGIRYDELTADGTREIQRFDERELSGLGGQVGEGSAIEIDLRDRFVEDLSLRELVDRLDPQGSTRVRLLADRAVFAGTRCDLGGVDYDVLSAEWALFTATHVSLDRANFVCQVEGDEDLHTLTVNFRDATFAATVCRVSFDDVVVGGDTRTITFEDAHFSTPLVSFQRARLNGVEVDFYQAQFREVCTVQFIETELDGASVGFADAELAAETADTHSSLIFYRVDPVAQLDLTFRNLGELRIENCAISAPIRVSNIARVSLWRSSISGATISVEGGHSAGETDANDSRVWFLDAIEAGRRGQRRELSAEFAVVKEIFHGMGDYDLEDESFVRHMRYKPARPLGRLSYAVLDQMGRFGTAPVRILISLVAAWMLFVVVDALALSLWPGAFDTLPSQGLWANAVVCASAAMTQGSSTVQPLSLGANLLVLVQSISGWFFLGYFFAAFVRRTQR